jgi:hypothetical protein
MRYLVRDASMPTPSSLDVKTQVRDLDMGPCLERERLAVREIQIAGSIDHIVHLIRAGQLEPRRIDRLQPVAFDDVGEFNPSPSFTRSHRTLILGRRGSEEDVRQAQR